MDSGERLKLVRETARPKKISMAAFGDEIGVSAATINQWEKGNTHIPKSSLMNICQKFNVNETWLITGEGSMNDPMTEEQEIAAIAAQMFNEDDELRKKIFFAVARLDSRDLSDLDRIVGKLMKQET